MVIDHIWREGNNIERLILSLLLKLLRMEMKSLEIEEFDKGAGSRRREEMSTFV